jgi:hypothetical protein
VNSIKKLLTIADAIPKLPCFLRALDGQHGLSDTAIRQSQHAVRHREFRIDFDSTPEERNGSGAVSGGYDFYSGAVSFQGFE